MYDTHTWNMLPPLSLQKEDKSESELQDVGEEVRLLHGSVYTDTECRAFLVSGSEPITASETACPQVNKLDPSFVFPRDFQRHSFHIKIICTMYRCMYMENLRRLDH